MAVVLTALFATLAGVYATWATYQARKKTNTIAVAAATVAERAQQWDELKDIVDYQSKQLDRIQSRLDNAYEQLKVCMETEREMRATIRQLKLEGR